MSMNWERLYVSPRKYSSIFAHLIAKPRLYDYLTPTLRELIKVVCLKKLIQGYSFDSDILIMVKPGFIIAMKPSMIASLKPLIKNDYWRRLCKYTSMIRMIRYPKLRFGQIDIGTKIIHARQQPFGKYIFTQEYFLKKYGFSKEDWFGMENRKSSRKQILLQIIWNHRRNQYHYKNAPIPMIFYDTIIYDMAQAKLRIPKSTDVSGNVILVSRKYTKRRRYTKLQRQLNDTNTNKFEWNLCQ